MTLLREKNGKYLTLICVWYILKWLNIFVSLVIDMALFYIEENAKYLLCLVYTQMTKFLGEFSDRYDFIMWGKWKALNFKLCPV